MNLELKKAVQNIVSDNKLDKIKEYSDIIVFGAGQSGDWVVNVLRKNGIYPKLYCDNYARKWGKQRNELKIESFERAVALYPDAAICIGSMWVEEIMEQIKEYDSKLLSRTWDLLATMAWETANMSYESTEKKYISDNLEKFEDLYDALSDEQSKRTMEGLLNYRLTRDKKYLSFIKSEETTYLDRTLFSEEMFQRMCAGSLIDGGAFDGDTAELFIWNLGSTKLDIHCYEPGVQNCKIIKEKMVKWLPHKITLHNTALWCEAEESISFVEDGLAGKVGRLQGTLKTETIDEYLYKKVGFIKMDIEGAERNALEGARRTIESCHPVLAICAYHLQDDLLVLSDFIRSLHCKYKIVLRHYMYSSGDTIMYAIPC